MVHRVLLRRITELYRLRTDDWVNGPTLPQVSCVSQIWQAFSVVETHCWPLSITDTNTRMHA